MDNQEPALWWQPGLNLFFKLSGWIAGPIIISLFLGKYLDSKFNSEPWIFLSLTAIAFLVSTAAIIYYYTAELRRIEAEEKLKKQIEGKFELK
ncbi:MAG: AtpZ/AtpI family protein [bacterium]